MESSALERLALCSPETEIWFDSSPLVYAGWRESFLGGLGEEERRNIGRDLDAFFNPAGGRPGYIRGATTNQPLTLQVLEADWPRWQAWARAAAEKHRDWAPRQVAWETFKEIVRAGSELLLPVYEASGARYGYICGQVDPRLNDDTAAMVAQALDLHAASPNIMIKMPGTAAGIEGVRLLTAKGIPTTTTLSFSVPQLIAVAEAHEAGLSQASASGVDLSHCRATGVMMLGRFEDHPVFKQQAAEQGIELSAADLRWAGVAIFKKAVQLYRQRRYRCKLLAASMRLGPMVDGRQRIWHLEMLAGAPAVLTIFPNIIEAFLLSYRAEPIEPRIDEEVPPEELAKLLRIPYFRQAYEEDGLRPEQFAGYPPVVATAESFTKAQVDFENKVIAGLA